MATVVFATGIIVSLAILYQRGITLHMLENEHDLHHQARMAAAVRNSSDMISIVDKSGRITIQAGSSYGVLGYAPAEMVGERFLDFVHPDDRVSDDLLTAHRPAAAEDLAIEWRMRRPDDSYAQFETVVTPLEATAELALRTRDIGARKEHEKQLMHRAFHDPLTRLANRALFQDRVDHAIALGTAKRDIVGVLFCDVDNFKQINDGMGHAFGDAVLVQVAKRLGDSVGPHSTVARLGGDEFGVLVEQVETREEVNEIARKIVRSFDEPLAVGDARVPIGISVGVAIDDAADVVSEQLIERADVAMYSAKQDGKSCFRSFSSEAEIPLRRAERRQAGSGRLDWLTAEADQRSEIESLLLEPSRVRTVFQPILDLRLERPAGYEALTRINSNPSRSPAAWIHQAHRCGLGVDLEVLALRKGLEAARDRPAGTFVSFNLGYSALVSPAVSKLLMSEPQLESIVIELTENELVIGGPKLDLAVAKLRKAGARIAVDDAGAGYAGLKHLTTFRPDIIKLDRTVVGGLHADEGRRALIDSFVRFSRKIDAAVCAEGIEVLDDLRELAVLDVAMGQGFAIGRPIAGWGGISPPAREVLAASNAEARSAGHAMNPADPTSDDVIERCSSLVAKAGSAREITPALELICDAVGAQAVFMLSLNEAGWAVETLAAAGQDRFIPGRRWAIEDYPATAQALGTGEAVQVLRDDPAADPMELAILEELGFGSMLMLPILSGTGAVGLLESYRSDCRPWSRYALGRLRLFSHFLGMRLEQIHPAIEAAGPGKVPPAPID